MMNFKFIFFLVMFTAVQAVEINASEIKDRSEAALKEQFVSDVIVQSIKWKLPPELKKNAERKSKQKFFKDYVYYWQVFDGDSLKAIAILDNVLGKSMPITFLVLFNLDGKIISSKIIKYREPYGGGVQSEKWNEQFAEKDSSSSYVIGKDIQGISGATISVSSVTRGIKKLSLIFNVIMEQL